MKILVTGGAGYIGSHAVRELIHADHSVCVLDNLTHGHSDAIHPNANFFKGNVGNEELVSRILIDEGIEAVMHFAADIEVGESVVAPGKYYRNNFSNALHLLNAMVTADVKKIVFSSTAAVYGEPTRVPIEETAARAAINPYGRSKMMTEMAIEDFSKAHGIGYAILRYFNVVGAAPDGTIGEDHRPESHLLPRILAVARDEGGEGVKIYGTDYPTKDGTCVRDYVHVVDLVRAHLLALKKIEDGKGEIYNLGSENGFSVREIIEACERVTGKTLRIQEEPRRAGDCAVLIASSKKIRENLGWIPAFPDIDTMVEHAWKWHRLNPKGYQK